MNVCGYILLGWDFYCFFGYFLVISHSHKFQYSVKPMISWLCWISCRAPDSNKRVKWSEAEKQTYAVSFPMQKKKKKKVQALSTHYTKWLISYSCIYIIISLFILGLSDLQFSLENLQLVDVWISMQIFFSNLFNFIIKKLDYITFINWK